METGLLFINGKWVESKKRFDQINPNTGNVYGSVCIAGKNDIDLAVNSATRALSKWSAMRVSDRANIVKNAANILIEMYGDEGKPTELKSLITDEMGKRLPEADIEVIGSSYIASYYANHAERLLVQKELILNKKLWPTKKSIIKYEPVGVVGIIKAWNYPLETPIWSLAPALVSGNTIVFKPSEYSSFTGLEIGKIFEKAGLPNGVLNIVTGKASTGQYIFMFH
jgi:acyl-CoA reductase-like NAD-dependent aldehyde dehydrogenase